MPQLNDEQKKEIERRIHRSACFQRLFRGADGEEVLKELRIECGAKLFLVSEDPRVQERYDPIRLAYRAKGKDLWLFIQNCLEGNVDEARKMLDAQTKTE